MLQPHKVLQPGVLAFTLKLFISIDCLLCKVVSLAFAWQTTPVLFRLCAVTYAYLRSHSGGKLHIKILRSFVHFVFKPPCRYSEQVERLFFQERDLRVGRHKCHAALPFRLPFRYHINMTRLQRPWFWHPFCAFKHGRRSGFPRSERQVGHVVSCFSRRPQGVCSPQWPQPDQPVLPWTHAVMLTHPLLSARKG